MSDIKWQDGVKMSELPHVAQALFNFAQDPTEDNSVGVVLSVMHTIDSSVKLRNIRTDIEIENLKHRIKELEDGHEQFIRAINFTLDGKGSDNGYMVKHPKYSFMEHVKFDEQDEYEVRLVSKTDANGWVEGDNIPLDDTPVLVQVDDEDHPYHVAYGHPNITMVGNKFKFDMPKILRWKRIDVD